MSAKITSICLLFLLLASKVCFCQSPEFVAAQQLASAYITSAQLQHDTRRNIVTDGNGTIHIFLFEDGNLLVRGFPTTADEKNKFQVHLYVRKPNTNQYLVDYVGKYEPAFNVQGTNPNPAAVAGPAVVPPERIDFAVAGPFTGSVVITLKQLTAGNYATLVSSNIKISKTVHASIGLGPVYTSLKNPSNIKALTLPNGDNTLIADDVQGRALLAVMATFYPWGRNELLIPSPQFKDRFGFLVGTSIANGRARFSDALLGVQYDFSIGGSFVGGAHYGRVQRVSGIAINNFSFGSEKFVGDIEARKYMDWRLGFFFGVQVDNRIFSQIFK